MELILHSIQLAQGAAPNRVPIVPSTPTTAVSCVVIKAIVCEFVYVHVSVRMDA